MLFSNFSYADLNDISRIYKQTPNINQFEMCQGGGCAKASITYLTVLEWQKITQAFGKPANAVQEREKIAIVIGALESMVGAKIGTSTDRAGTFDNSDFVGQMDCNDEAINTTTFMRLLKQHGLIQWHEIEDTRTRNFFFTGWPHTTAVLRDIKTGERFAVDSWFYDNGHAATIVPFTMWKANYFPPDSPIGKSQTAAKPTQ